MELSKSEYQYECPVCKTKTSTGIISAKDDKKRYFCNGCFCEFEIHKNSLTVFKLSEAGSLYPVKIIKLKGDKKHEES